MNKVLLVFSCLLFALGCSDSKSKSSKLSGLVDTNYGENGFYSFDTSDEAPARVAKVKSIGRITPSLPAVQRMMHVELGQLGLDNGETLANPSSNPKDVLEKNRRKNRAEGEDYGSTVLENRFNNTVVTIGWAGVEDVPTAKVDPGTYVTIIQTLRNGDLDERFQEVEGGDGGVVMLPFEYPYYFASGVVNPINGDIYVVPTQYPDDFDLRHDGTTIFRIPQNGEIESIAIGFAGFSASDIARDSNGRIVLSGTIGTGTPETIGTGTRADIWAALFVFTADLELDITFGINGLSVYAFSDSTETYGKTIAIDKKDNIILGGVWAKELGSLQIGPYVASINNFGTVNGTPWGTSSQVYFVAITDIAFDNQNNILAGAIVEYMGSRKEERAYVSGGWVACFDSNLLLDVAFGNNGTSFFQSPSEYSYIYPLSIQPTREGGCVLTGWYEDENEDAHAFVAQLRRSGELDANFGENGYLIFSDILGNGAGTDYFGQGKMIGGILYVVGDSVNPENGTYDMVWTRIR